MNWRQVSLVLKREYLTRVKSKGFIAATLLVPIGIIAIYGIGFLVIIWENVLPIRLSMRIIGFTPKISYRFNCQHAMLFGS